MAFYVQGDNMFHRGYALHGLCKGLAAGLVTVSLHVGTCYDSYSEGNPYTGWNQENILIMEESRLGNDITAVLTPSGHAYRLPVVNRQHGWWLSLNLEITNALIKAFVYNKIYSDSGINVIWSFNCRILGNPDCGRWYVTFNGTTCNNPGSIERVLYESGPSVANWHQPCWMASATTFPAVQRVWS
ncbi:collagen triple helix repeat-containing protein 1-like isoform X2 [Lingula anatina]|uniref:Collagen triple helix repeat-containing protein 1-like isoform X2 n=1 Tax=Lingula anatina TaxID=7574 RepID=A0A1S3H5T4_LINAN|nr:collagen triple helix repeat-containing protein 1-like isoform X2 [Lingula anatina]|eukprot:XP_013380489.1 collagen triple helix repeat-containing protein 1-like isoform X2 [Lingula anatina]